MSWKPDRYGRLRALLWRPSLDEEVREEIEHHIDERVAANVARGMSEQAARQAALQRFGDIARFARETVEIDESVLRETRRMEVVDTLRRELKQSLRGLMRAPLFTIVAVVTLALAIAASTAVYTLLKSVVLDPLPYPAADRLVLIDHLVPELGDRPWSLSTASYFHFRERMRTVDEVAMFWANSANLRAQGEAIRGTATSVSGNLFELLGARPEVGRLIASSDDTPDAPRVAVLSYDYWQSEFGGARDVVGRSLEVNGRPAEVVGVLQRGFALPEVESEVFVARRLDPAGPHVNWHHMTGIARRKPGVTLTAVQSELTQLNRELPERYPTVYNAGDFTPDPKFFTRVQDLRSSIVGELARVLWILLGSVAVVLIIASVNVANLFMVRADSRRNEQAVRSALGAERAHLFVQALSESLLVTAVAGAMGILLAYGGLKFLVAIAPSSLPRLDEVQLSTEHGLFGFALSLTAGVVFAIFPLLRRGGDYTPLREAGRGLTASRVQLRVRSTLVTAQIALAVILLASAGLMLRSFQAMRSVDLGFDPDNVLTMAVSLPARQYDTYDKANNFWRRLTEEIDALPGVQSVGATGRIPGLGVGCAVLTVTPRARNTERLGCMPNTIVSPGFFEAAGIEVEGRTPTWSDIDNNTGAVVISRALANLLWPGEDAIGRGVRVPQSHSPVYYTIVGVAEDIRGEGARKPATELVYYPVKEIEGAPLWGQMTAMSLMIRTSTSDPVALAPAVRRIVASLDPAAAVGDVNAYQTIIDESMIQTTFTTVLLGIAGSMALVLSIVGLYGVVAYTVSRRRSEIGIRMALGAQASEVRVMFVLQSMKLGTFGVGIGLVGAALTTQLLRSMLFNVEPTDGLTLSIVAFSLLFVAALASLVPAWRAAAVNPTETFRS